MREYILECGTVSVENAEELMNKYLVTDFTVYAIYSDHFYCGKELATGVSNLMELRIFNEDSEFKMIRYDLGNNFHWRFISDKYFKEKLCEESDKFLKSFENRTFDEVQYIDIDQKKSSGTDYVTTGGGTFSLPVENAEKIHIRSYLDYDAHGILAINDFRIVRILREAEK